MSAKYKRGFTLIELMIVIAIILIIAAIAIPQLMKSKKSANEAAAVSALQDYAKRQKDFMKQGADRSPANSAVPGGYVANFRNLYYGNPVDDDGQPETSELLKMIPKDMADAFIVDAGNTNRTPTAPATAATPYHGYLFREPRELNPGRPSDFASVFSLIAYPADSSTTGSRVYWIGLQDDDKVVMYYQDLPAGRTAENNSDIDTPSGGSTTGWSGM